MSLHTLVYTSVASQKMTDDALKDILGKSRRKNDTGEITGMLLYMDPYFIQVLEGEEAAITTAFDRIKQDPRHQKVSIIYKKPIAERCFADWTMGFNKVTQAQIGKLEGLSDYLQRPITEFFQNSPNKVTELLNMFRREILF
jgi:hypothetical protein